MDSNSPTSDPRICTVSVPPEPQGSWSENRVCLLPPPSVSLLGFGRGGRFGFFLSPANFVWPPAPCEHLTHTQTPAEEALGKCETQPALCPDGRVPFSPQTLSPLSSFVRTPRGPRQPGHFQHWPPLRDLAIQAGLRRENLHLPLAGRGPGKTCQRGALEARQPAPSLGRVHALGYKIIRVSTYVNFYMQPSDGQAPEMPIFPALSHPHVTSTPAHLSHKCTPVPSGG